MSWINRTHSAVLELAKSKKKQRQFIVLIALVFAVVGGVKWYQEKDFLIPFIIVGSLIVTLVLPIIWFPILVLWFWFGKVMGEISSTIILGFIYFGFFFPITFIRRVFGKKAEIGWKVHSNESDYTKQH